ncbi:hypothetical protein NQ317_012755 [Molorchus minor]|uniref:Uncharacterized protein n=1 Tax=Molorchus minor TaxID=1323400 RepID=A0ABQ9K3E0_9CUCU|nr:hypothetical protein NQ317_012755 [Molorchus minor]
MLVLCDNKIESLPANIANLHKLRSLLLHKNVLRTLPPEIIALKNLTEEESESLKLRHVHGQLLNSTIQEYKS